MVVQELIAKLGFDVDQAGLGRADKGIESLAAGALKAVGAMYLAKKAFDAFAAGVMGSINAASQKEDVTTQFKVLLGDLEAAKYLYQEVNQYAAVSPFETAGLAENLKTLIAMGMSAKSAFGDLKMLGDVALGDQAKLSRMALTYGQVMSLGRLQGDNMREFALQGWNPLTYWQAKSGKSMEQLRKDMEKGLISSAMVQEALAAATSQGGRFYRGAEEGSKTWSGMMSTMRDNIRMLGAELGEKLLPTLKAILTEFMKLWPAIASAYVTLADFFGILFRDGPSATDWASGFAASMEGVADAIMFVLAAFQTLWTGVALFGETFELIIVGVIESILQIPKYLAYVWKGLTSLVVAAGKASGNSAMQRWGAGERQKAEDFIGPGLYNYTSEFMGTGDRAESRWAKAREMWEKLGTRSPTAAKLGMTDRIESILSGNAAKQPITNITQNNNLTVNAEDPIKTMSESASAKFFQGAFIQIRHATT
jgi:hypothetical protein